MDWISAVGRPPSPAQVFAGAQPVQHPRSLYSTHAPQLESGGRANVTVELRQDKLEDDPVFRERVLRCVVEAFS
jgi:hypothetical protein